MSKSKVVGNKGGSFSVKGGSTKMFGQQHAGPQVPGQSAQMKAGDGGKYAKGGSSNHMFGQQHANTQECDVSGHTTSSLQTKFSLQTGGKNHMFGYTGSKPARPA